MFVISIGTKKRTKIFLIVLLVLLISGGVILWKNMPYRFFDRVEPGVVFMGEELGGSTRKQIEEMMAAKLVEWRTNPVDAVYSSLDNNIVPEIWGYTIIIEETINKIMSAGPGETVEPFYEPIVPQITLADYPSAVIRKGNPAKKQIALMINVAWGSEYIGPMLDILDAGDAAATFFVVGDWARKNSNLMEEIFRSGHLLANHGHTDSLLYTELTAAEIQNGLDEVNRLIFNVTGEYPQYFTPHEGEYNRLVLETVSRQGMRTVLWTLDTVDWMNPGVEKMHERVTEKIHAGAIVLMHPTGDTVLFLKEAIPAIKNKGFEFVTIRELLSPHYPPLFFSEE